MVGCLAVILEDEEDTFDLIIAGSWVAVVVMVGGGGGVLRRAASFFEFFRSSLIFQTISCTQELASSFESCPSAYS